MTHGISTGSLVDAPKVAAPDTPVARRSSRRGLVGYLYVLPAFLVFAVFLGAPKSWPVTVMLNNTAGSGAVAVQYSQQMASALLASLPTLIVYILLGRYFMRGLMAGALKG